MRWKALRLGVALASAMIPVGSRAGCALARFAELPVTIAGSRPLIAGSVNGLEAHFLVDSGAVFSVLSRGSAERFQLPLHSLPWGFHWRGIGGEGDARMTSVRDLALAGLDGGAMHQIDFIVNGAAHPGVDGKIGQNILGLADAEYDLANGFIRLFHSDGCGQEMLAYWAGTLAVAVIPIERSDDRSSHLIGHAKLNGSDIRLIIDSGAPRSMISLQTAARAGIHPSDPGVRSGGVWRGVGPREIESWIARFDSLDIGGERVKNALLRIGRLDLPENAGMLLGADFFLSHRLYIARAQRKIYFTFNGGAVFDLHD